MVVWWALCLLAAATGGGGVTRDTDLSQFWTDDYKVFEQVYGKTSDRDLFGAPPPVVQSGRSSRLKEATETKQELANEDTSNDFYTLSDRYVDLITKNSLKDYSLKEYPKKNFNFISPGNFNPISETSNPVAYNYLKHMEQLGKQNPEEDTATFKPYLAYGVNPEAADAYKSIQDILDAHEANRGRNKGSEEEEHMNYLNYSPPKPRKKPSSRYVQSNGGGPRCQPGRCRKRNTSRSRAPRPRPYIRTIKKIVYES